MELFTKQNKKCSKYGFDLYVSRRHTRNKFKKMIVLIKTESNYGDIISKAIIRVNKTLSRKVCQQNL